MRQILVALALSSTLFPVATMAHGGAIAVTGAALPTQCARVGLIGLRTTDNSLWISTSTPGCDWRFIETSDAQGGYASIEVRDPAGSTSMAFSTPGAFVKWVGANRSHSGGTFSTEINSRCTAAGAPYTCCSNENAGTCGTVIVGAAGTHHVTMIVNADGTTAVFTCHLYVNDAQRSPILVAEVRQNQDVFSSSFFGDVDLNDGDRLDMRCSASQNAQLEKIYSMSLYAERASQ